MHQARTLVLYLGCRGVFSPFSFFVNISFNGSQTQIMSAFFVGLGFFPRLDGQKGTQQDVFSQDIALLIFWYPKQCARTALWDVVTIVNTSHRWIHIQILKYTSCVMSTHDCGIQ